MLQGHLFSDILAAHVYHSSIWLMNELESDNQIESEDKLDMVCESKQPDWNRPGVPFELKHCCEADSKNIFEEEAFRKKQQPGKTAEKAIWCHVPTSSVFVIKRWTVAVTCVLLLFMPLLVVCFPRTPKPYKALPDALVLHKNSSKKKKMFLARVNYDGKCMDVEEQAEEGNLIDRHNDIQTDTKASETEGHDSIPEPIMEGVHFRNEFPDRLYLDSDPEFHLNLNIIVSYLLLFHINNHVLTVVRRLVFFYVTWMVIGIGFFTCMTYYPILLDEPFLSFQLSNVLHRLLDWISHNEERHDWVAIFKFLAFIMPAFCAFINFVLLSPILWKKQSIAETLYCNGDLQFFGDPFPESIVQRNLLRKTPKPSKLWTHELLLHRNMLARLANLTKIEFWKLLWQRWVCRGHTCRDPKLGEDSRTSVHYACAVLWFPCCVVLVVLHVLPCFSVWANYVRMNIKKIVSGPWPRRALAAVLLIIQLLGIVALYIMIWDLAVMLSQFAVFLFIDILRNAATTLSKIILMLAIFTYLRNAFQEFEDSYRELKSVTFSLCMELASDSEGEESNKLVVARRPFEPLFIKSRDGEASIPRRTFYEICHTYRPYYRAVASTFIHLFLTFSIILIIFLLIAKFNVFEQFSEVGEPLITVATVSLPSLLGVSKSSTHQGLSEQRRDLLIRTWLENTTVTRRVNLNLNKPTKRVVFS